MLRHLLHESRIFIDVKERCFEAVMQCLPVRLFDTSLPHDLSGIRQIAIRNGVVLGVIPIDHHAEPQMALCISRWGVESPAGAHTSLLFFLFMPRNNHEIENRVKYDLERIVRDRFILERIKIAEAPSEVMEVLMREHGSGREAVAAPSFMNGSY